jgi:hypothetical protein
MPAKPIRNGFKAHTLNDSKTGYLYNFELFTRDHPQHLQEAAQYRQGLQDFRHYYPLRPDAPLAVQAAYTRMRGDACLERKGKLPEVKDKLNTLVKRIVRPIQFTGRIVCTDRYYSSPALARDLRLHHGVGFIGTLKDGRKGYPKKLKPKKSDLERGEFKVLQGQTTTTRHLTIAFWLDSSLVTFLSSVVDPLSPTPTVDRTNSKTGVTSTITAPPHSPLYTSSMGGTDLFNALLQRYYHPQRVPRWWVSIFQWLLHAASTNAYILWRSFPWSQAYRDRAKIDHKEFLERLIRALIGDYDGRKEVGRPSGLLLS